MINGIQPTTMSIIVSVIYHKKDIEEGKDEEDEEEYEEGDKKD